MSPPDVTPQDQPAAATTSFSYGSSRWRWLTPVILSLLLIVCEEQGVLALLTGIFLLVVYLPKSFGKRYRHCRHERLIRFAVYISAVLVVLGFRPLNISIANERAARIIAAAETYKAKNGGYPGRLEELAPAFIPKIPNKARITLTDNGFRYAAQPGHHTLSYVVFPPFGRRVYEFESRSWKELD